MGSCSKWHEFTPYTTLYSFIHNSFIWSSNIKRFLHSLQDLHQGGGHLAFVVLYSIWLVWVRCAPLWPHTCSATLKTLTNDIFRPHFDQFVVVYVDDILIFSRTLKEHMTHVRTIPSLLPNKQFIWQVAWVFLLRGTSGVPWPCGGQGWSAHGFQEAYPSVGVATTKELHRGKELPRLSQIIPTLQQGPRKDMCISQTFSRMEWILCGRTIINKWWTNSRPPSPPLLLSSLPSPWRI